MLDVANVRQDAIGEDAQRAHDLGLRQRAEVQKVAGTGAKYRLSSIIPGETKMVKRSIARLLFDAAVRELTHTERA